MNPFEDPTLKVVPIGKIQTKSARTIESSPISVGFETLDRRMFKPEMCYDRVSELGVKWARCQTGWSRCETTRGVLDFGWLDETVDALLSRGVQPWFNLGFGNILYMPDAPHESAVGYVPTAYGGECLDAWKRYVEQITAHFKGRVRHWEIWNEPNIPEFWMPSTATGGNYAELVAVTSPIIRAVDSDAMILGCMSGIDLQFVVDALKAGIGQHIDGYSTHPYTAPACPEKGYLADVAALRRLFTQYAPHVKIWQGECGYPAEAYGHQDQWMQVYYADEQSQAKFVLRRIVLDATAEMEIISYFHIADLMEQPYRQSDGAVRLPVKLGLLHGLTYEPKQSYHALRNIAPIFDGKLVHDVLYADLQTGVDLRREGALPYLAPVIGTFVRLGYPVYTFYYPEDLQRSWRGLSGVALRGIHQTANALEEPVIVDCLSGNVYKALDITNDARGFAISGLPLTDYPLIVTDARAIDTVAG